MRFYRFVTALAAATVVAAPSYGQLVILQVGDSITESTNTTANKRHRTHLATYFGSNAVFVGRREGGTHSARNGWTTGNFLSRADPLTVGKGPIRNGSSYAAASPATASGTTVYYPALDPGFPDTNWDGTRKIAAPGSVTAPFAVHSIDNLSGWAVDFGGGATPHFVTVMLGTNDVDQSLSMANAKTNIDAIVDTIRNNTGAKAVLLAKIVEFSPGVTEARDALEIDLNGHIGNQSVSTGTKVCIVDQRAGETSNESSAPSNTLVASDYVDNKHPFTVSGAKKVARNFTICMMKEVFDDQWGYQFLIGDFDGNGEVEFSDWLTVSGNFGQQVDKYADGDVDGDGYVGFVDNLRVSANFGKTLADFAP